MQMPSLNEAALLGLIKRRWAVATIYTRIGEVLISVNPYYNIKGLYDVSESRRTQPVLGAFCNSSFVCPVASMKLHFAQPHVRAKPCIVCNSLLSCHAQMPKPGETLPPSTPHLYTVAESAYQAMVSGFKSSASQSILINGESGR
jgi:myosin heavy subunit